MALLGALASSLAHAQSSDTGAAEPTGETEREVMAELEVIPWEEQRFTLHSRPHGSSAPFTRLCNTPCAVRVEPSIYELAVSTPGGAARRAGGQSVALEGPSVVQIHYDHRAAFRVLGWIFFSIGVSALGSGIGLDVLSGSGFFAPLIGLPIMGFMLPPFLVLAFLEDSARVQVFPLLDPDAGPTPVFPSQ